MKTILAVGALIIAGVLSSGCADTPVPAGRTASYRSSSESGGGIDPVTQAGIDETARQTQEDAQRMSDWETQQMNQQMQDQANQMANQAAMDASNAAAAAAAAAAANQQ
jgi:hypothetical protein